jgi:hypothetical protein
MAKQSKTNKAAVQSTELNKLPISNEADTEFASAEPAAEAAKAFQNKVTDKNLQ